MHGKKLIVTSINDERHDSTVIGRYSGMEPGMKYNGSNLGSNLSTRGHN
jgi:hypothetical protein